MPVKIHGEFISDLIQVGAADLAGRALRKCFDTNGRFIDQAKEDHRYNGIADAWIRKISKGMRIIYLKNGEDVTLYRAGQHSIEDNLRAPKLRGGIPVELNAIERAMQGELGEPRRKYAMSASGYDDIASASSGAQQNESRLLYSHTDRFLYGNLLGRRFLPHKDVYLVSPSISLELMRSTHPFGQMLDELIEGGATIWLLTRPPLEVDDLLPFNELEARGINVYFNVNVHAKVYAFVLNRDYLTSLQQDSNDFLAIGSANLTLNGMNPHGLSQDSVQYELSYQANHDDWDRIERFVLHLAELSTELSTVRNNLISQKG